MHITTFIFLHLTSCLEVLMHKNFLYFHSETWNQKSNILFLALPCAGPHWTCLGTLALYLGILSSVHSKHVNPKWTLNGTGEKSFIKHWCISNNITCKNLQKVHEEAKFTIIGKEPTCSSTCCFTADTPCSPLRMEDTGIRRIKVRLLCW